MAYNNAIPAPGDLLSQSQDDILKNFQAINTFVNINHEAFNSVAPHAQGKHKQIEMPVQAAAVATDPTQWSMYVKNNTLGVPAPAVWLTPPVSAQHPAPANPIDITTATMASPGRCTLPCGLVLQWGTGTADPANPTVFPTAFATACIHVMICSRDPGANVNNFVQALLDIGANNRLRFTTKSYSRSGAPSTASIYWFAIGY